MRVGWWVVMVIVASVWVSSTRAQENSDRCDDLNEAGLSAGRQAQYSEALKQFQQANACYLEIGDRAGEALSLHNIGRIYDNLGQYEQALDYYQQSLTISKEIGNRVGEGAILNSIGSMYGSLGQYKQALEYLQQGLTILKEMGVRAGEGQSLHNIGAIYVRLGQYEQALDYCQQSLIISQETGDQVGEGTILHTIGTIYNNLGQYEQALDYYMLSLTIRHEIGDRAGEGVTLNNIGSIYDNLGQYEQALDYYQQSLTIGQQIGNRAGEGTILNNIGVIYVRLGQYEQALDYYQQSLAISQEIGNRADEGTALDNIGDIYEHLGQYEQALDYYQQSLTIGQEISNRAGEGTALNSIGSIYEHLGQYEQALDYYQQSLTISQEIGNRVGEGAALNSIGSIYVLLGQYEQALDYSQQGLTISQEVGSQANEGIAFDNIGLTYASLGQYEQALEYYQQAIETLEIVRSQAGSEAGRASFIEQYISTYHRTVDLFYQQGQTGPAFQTIERGRARAFLDSLATGQVRLRDDEAAELLTQEQERYSHRQAIRFELAEAKAKRPARVVELEQQLAEAEAAYKEVQAAIAARGAELAALVPGRSAKTVLGVEQVQPLLDKQTTLVAYYILEDKVLAFIVTAGSFETVTLEVAPTELKQEIITFRDFANTNAAYPDSAIALYKWLIAPFKDKLTTPHLIIIPHQQLHYLPFAALTDGKHYLIDDYTLTVLPSASILPFIQKNAKQTAYSGQPSALILGNPATGDYDTTASLVVDQRQYRDQLGSLPFAEKEAKAIAELFGVKPLIGKAATENAVREQVPQANILHLAAHGQFNSVAPLNSLIALAPDPVNNSPSTIDNSQLTDGWLTVGEVYGLDLKKTDLVVLSACETNLGDLSEGDELVGLTRAFIFAGTPSVIASLWNVEDEATSLLMERFYTHLKDGMGKAEALRQAQLEVREEYPNPYYWAAFVLSGDGG